ncbi:MAK10-like protein [Tanacetum coccineum]|uniref:MAK10-like protein n=1 Tax=Tanacetum coccineum TaxID=301880 RepID=A0ABQ5HM47_9ASTR
MDYIHMTEAELGINLDIPLSKQDPLNKLNDLANKKRKHADDIHDYFKAKKRLKSSVQYEDHLLGIVLNEPVLDENPIRILRDYSKPSHEGYRNTIELPDPNQHLKDFLKLVDSLDLDGENRKRTRLRLFQFSLRDQASNWLDRLLAGSITTWEDLTTRFLAQFFPPRRIAKLRNDILMFQQHHGESLSEAWTCFKELLQKVPHHGIDLWLQDLALYENESWNDPRDFAKPVKEIALPQDVPNTSDLCLIELENQVQRLMEAHLAPTQPTQVNKITTSYARLSKFEVDFKRQQGEMTNKIDTVLKAITDQIAGTLPSDTAKNLKLSTTLVLSARSYPTQDLQYSNNVYGSINAITIHPKQLEGSQVNRLDEGQEGEGNLGNTISNPHPQPGPLASIITEQVGVLIISQRAYNILRLQCSVKTVFGNIVFLLFPLCISMLPVKLILDGLIDSQHPRMSQVLLGKPFVEISNMTHDPQEGVVRFTNRNDKVSYKMPHKIEQYNSLSNLEKEHTKLVYLWNEEYKRRGVEYVMNKILGFYKECLKLGPEYLTGMDDEGEVT